MRIRTVMDEATGRVKSAYYMKKDGGIFDAGGFLLNPTPKDTNLEQDSKIRVQTVQPQEL